MRWVDDWPQIGIDTNGDGIGEPVLRYPKPNVLGEHMIQAPDDSDEFKGAPLGLQWQWQANPKPDWYAFEKESHLRLFSFPIPEHRPSQTIYDAPHLLLQKFPAEAFHAEAKLDGTSLKPGERAGLIIFGRTFAYAGVRMKTDGSGMEIIQAEGNDMEENIVWSGGWNDGKITIRVTVHPGGKCRFDYAAAEACYLPCGEKDFIAEKVTGSEPRLDCSRFVMRIIQTEGMWTSTGLGSEEEKCRNGGAVPRRVTMLEQPRFYP